MALNHALHTEALSTTNQRTPLSKAGAAATFGLVPFDVAISDSMFYRSQRWFSNLSEPWHLTPTAEWLFSRGTTVGAIGASALLLGGLVKKSDPAREAFEGFEEYSEVKRQEMAGIRKAASAVINSPINLLIAVGKKFESGGEKFKKSESKIVREAGQTAIDIGRTNSMSTTGAILYENSEENQVKLGRMSRIAGTFAMSWIGTTEAIRWSYRGLGELRLPGRAAQEAAGGLGRLAYNLTAVGLPNPLETPVATTFMGGVAAACVIAGSRAVNYNDALKNAAISEIHPLNPAA